jgi:hypothetical protein
MYTGLPITTRKEFCFTFYNKHFSAYVVPVGECVLYNSVLHWIIYQSLCHTAVSRVATGYGLDGPGIESRWGARFSASVQTGPGAHPTSCTMGTGNFPGVKSGWGVTLTPHPLLLPWSGKSRAISPLPLWAVRPVQSLSACTRVHFTFFLIGLPISTRWEFCFMFYSKHFSAYVVAVGSCVLYNSVLHWNIYQSLCHIAVHVRWNF